MLEGYTFGSGMGRFICNHIIIWDLALELAQAGVGRLIQRFRDLGVNFQNNGISLYRQGYSFVGMT